MHYNYRQYANINSKQMTVWKFSLNLHNFNCVLPSKKTYINPSCVIISARIQYSFIADESDAEAILFYCPKPESDVLSTGVEFVSFVQTMIDNNDFNFNILGEECHNNVYSSTNLAYNNDEK